MFGFSRDFLVILLHKLIFILSSSGSTLHAWIREGVRTLSPGEFKFLKFTRHVFRHFYCFQEKHILHAGNRGTWGSELLPGKIQICQVYTVKLPKKKIRVHSRMSSSTKRAKYSFHFLTCLKTKLHVHVTIEGILSIINFLYECQCKCECMEKVATWSVHYSFRYIFRYKQYMLFEFMTIH